MEELEYMKIIAKVVMKPYQVSYDDLKSRSKKRDLVIIRHLIMALARKHTKLPFEDIGAHIGRDHTTAMHACKKVSGYRDIYPEFRKLYAEFESDAVSEIARYKEDKERRLKLSKTKSVRLATDPGLINGFKRKAMAV
jgi:hypothetical protein